MTTPREIIEKLKQEEAAVQPKEQCDCLLCKMREAKFEYKHSLPDWVTADDPVRYDFYSPQIFNYFTVSRSPAFSARYTQT